MFSTHPSVETGSVYRVKQRVTQDIVNTDSCGHKTIKANKVQESEKSVFLHF